MKQRRHLAIVAGAATVLAATALASVYESKSGPLFIIQSPNWFLYIVTVVAAVVAGSIGARALRAPVWAQPIGGAFALLIYVTVIFGDGFLGIIPTPGTFETLDNELNTAFNEIAELSAPVPIHRGLLLLAVLGVGFVAIIVDLIAIGMRRASLAGLPLLALYAVPVSIDRNGMQWWTFALGAIGYLWLLTTDQIERVQRWGRPFRADSPDEPWTTTSLGTTGRWVGLFGIGIAVFVPLFVPGISAAGVFGSGLGVGPGNGAGKSVETIAPMTELRGRLTQAKETEEFRIRTNDPDRFYVRLTTLDKFNTTGWTQGQLTARPEDRVSNGIKSDDDLAPGVPVSRQKTNIEIRGLSGSAFLPIYANPTKIDVDGDWRWDDGADTVFSSRSSTGKLKYSFESVRVEYDRDRLASAPPLDPSDAVVNDFTSTSGRVDDTAEAVLLDVLAGKKTQYEKVMAINDYFSPENGFQYTLETVAGTTGSDLGDFLVEKKGYCQQYASATAYLMRAAGIPARVAVGFDRGIQKDGYVSVTNKNAHAWVEVYFNGLGWVPFDTTPAGGDGRSAGLLPWARDASDDVTTPVPGASAAPSASATPGVTNPDDLADDPDRGLSLDAGPTTPKPIDVPLAVAPLGGIAGGLIDGGHWPDLPLWVELLLGLALVLLIAAIPALVRIQTRRHRMHVARSSNALVAAHSAWDELLDMLADLGMAADDSETPRATARRLSATGLDQAERHAVELLATDEERARYAPRGGAASTGAGAGAGVGAGAAGAGVGAGAGRATGRAAVGTASVVASAVAGAGVVGAGAAGVNGRGEVGHTGTPRRAEPAPGGSARRSKGNSAQRAEATQRILAVQVVWRALSDRAGRGVRIRALLLPPSLVARTNVAVARSVEESSVTLREWGATIRRRILPNSGGPQTHP